MSDYLTLKGYGRDTIEDRKSVFIGTASFASTEEEALSLLSRVRAEFSDAKHHVYAYLLREGQKTRYSDDREPQGTAGLPVLDVLRKQGLSDVAVVVTRYFGGILLGTGGLVRAYTEAASAALKAAGIVRRIKAITMNMSCSYSDYERMQSLLLQKGASLKGSDFTDRVSLTFSLPEALREEMTAAIIEAGCGKIIPTFLNDGWMDVEI